MSDIAVAHPDLTAKGGAESVCMHALEALAADHDVTLLTVTEPSMAALDAYYDTDVVDVTVRRVGPVTRWFNAVAEKRVVDLPVPRLRLLELALFNRYLRRVADDFDLVVSTYNEYALDAPSVQYVHHPNYRLGAFPTGPERGRWVGAGYAELSQRVGGFDDDALDNATLVANSEWTASEFTSLYGHEADILYPPVKTAGLDGRNWSERENGFVIVSRLSPDKRVLQGLRIVDRLVERGHDIHVHAVGSATSEDYAARVAEFAANRPHINVEGGVSRSELTTLVGKHRYGLHAKHNEHFGIAVAELVAGGTIPFVPDGGGQREIVADDTLVFGSVDEAVERIEPVLSSPARQAELRKSLPDIESKFGVKRFQREFRELVANALETKS